MTSIYRSLSLSIVLAASAYGAADGAISGAVKDAAGAPFKGAFVRVQNSKTKITVNVLSDEQGRYRVPSLPPGEYELRATAIGYNDDRHTAVTVAAGQSASLDFSLQNGAVHWSDLSIYQGNKLLPERK